MAARVARRKKDKKLGWAMIPDCGGEALTETYRLLAEVYQLLNEYAPVWYSTDLRNQLQTALKPPERNTPPPLVVNRLENHPSHAGFPKGSTR